MIQKKICMIGAFGVGKTSLVARFVKSIFSDKYLTTVGVKIDKKEIIIDGENLTLMLWDLAGKDAVNQIKPEHLRGCSGYVLVADGTRADTLKTATELHDLARQAAGDVPCSVVVNKADLRDQWEVNAAQLHLLEDSVRPPLLTSAKTGDGVEQLFVDLATRILRKDHGREQPAAASAR